MIRRAMYQTLLAVSLLAALAGCDSSSSAPDPEGSAGAGDAPASMSGSMDHSAGHHSADAEEAGQLLADERLATALATVVSVRPAERELTLDHEPLEGIGMSAMTMAFGVAQDVSLSALEPGKRVAVRIVQRKNYTYEVVAICETPADSLACLD